MAFFFIVSNQGSLVIDIQGASKNPVSPLLYSTPPRRKRATTIANSGRSQSRTRRCSRRSRAIATSATN
jgi:hypothetical protein